MIPTPIGFRVVGAASNRRIIVAHDRALRAYCACDPGAGNLTVPAFLSAHAFPTALSDHCAATGSTAGYVGAVGVPTLNFDIDRADLDDALRDARRLAHHLAERYGCDPIVMFSGSKGFHVMLPTCSTLDPAPDAHRVAGALAATLAGEAGIVIDTGVYDALRLWRAPNSRHGKTGLHKNLIPDLDDLDWLNVAMIRERAAEPIEFDWPTPATPPRRLADDLAEAAKGVRAAIQARREAHATGAPRVGRINPTTKLLLTDPGEFTEGERHRTIFSAAADLASFGTVEALVKAVLTEPGLDTGLPPREVERQIDCGIAHGRKSAEGGGQ